MTICHTATIYAFNLILAEFFWRLGRILWEIYLYPKHYPPNSKFSTAFRCGFHFTNRSCYALLVVALLLAIQRDSPSTLCAHILEKWLLLPVCWLFRYTELTKSMLDNSDFIRSESGLDAASSMVNGYFHGYLNLILPRSPTTDDNKIAVFGIYIIIGELCWRFAKSMKEIYFCSIYYPYIGKKRVTAAFRHGFTFSSRSRYLLGIVTLLAIRFVNVATFYKSFLDQWPLLPIWWVVRYTEFTRSMFDYSEFIRSTSGLDYASGMAANYFHAYINEVIIRTSTSDGIIQRIERYESKHRVQFAIKRLFILIPYSLHTKPVIESKIMERQDNQPLEGVTRDRAGVERPYINSVYRILIDKKPFYVTIEGATPLQSFYDTLHSKYTMTTAVTDMQREILIKFKKYLQNVLQKCPGTQGQCEVVFYNDYKPDGQPQDVGEILALHIKSMWAKMPADERPCELEMPSIVSLEPNGYL